MRSMDKSWYKWQKMNVNRTRDSLAKFGIGENDGFNSLVICSQRARAISIGAL